MLTLVSCVSKKSTVPAPAKELYRSVWFSKAKAYVEQEGAQWVILSAKHGLLQPGEVIDPYDLVLSELSRAERCEWAVKVFQQIISLGLPQKELTVFAGKLYRIDLIPLLQGDGWKVSVPLQGLGSGSNRHGFASIFLVSI